MKTYKIVFTCQSVVNEIPNSQTIFGVICNILLQTRGKDALDEYISSLNAKAKMVHSSMFLNHTLPMIKKNVFSSLEYPWFRTEVLKISDDIQDVMSDEFVFCRDLKKNGYKIYIDPTVVIGNQQLLVI